MSWRRSALARKLAKAFVARASFQRRDGCTLVAVGLIQRDVDDIVDACREWSPGALPTERAYEESLYLYLNEVFPKERFERQYRQAKTIADIFVAFVNGGARVAIELKAGVTGRGEMHRVIGQTYEYLFVWNAEAVVIFCGACDPALTKITRDAIAMFNDRLAVRKARFIDMSTPALVTSVEG